MKEKESVLDAIELLEKRIFSQPYSKKYIQDLLKNSSFSVIYIAEASLVSYMILMITQDFVEILKIATSHTERRKKYAKHLIDYVQKNISADIFLELRHSNVGAFKFYENCGFKTLNLRKNYYSDTGEDAIVMKKNGGSNA